MSYPTSTPTYAGFTSSHTLAADSHAAQHNSEQTDIIGLANKVGLGVSTPTSGTILRGNGTGTSTWDTVHLSSDVQGVLGTGNGGTGTTSTTGTGSVVFGTAPTLSNPTISGGGSWSGSPTLTTPTIADFTNANHNHSNTVNGGQIGTSGLANGAVTPAILSLGSQTAFVLTSEATSSGTFVDLATVGPSVTVTVPSTGIVLVFWASQMTAANGLVSATLSGANTVAATSDYAIFSAGNEQMGSHRLFTGLTPGSTTFKLQYSSTSGSVTFLRRLITVIPLG